MIMTLEEYIEHLNAYPADAKLTDKDKLKSVIYLAKNWIGTDISTVENLKNALLNHTQMQEKDIEALYKSMIMKVELGGSFNGYDDYVNKWAKTNNIQYSLDHRLTVKGNDVSDDHMFNKVFLLGSNHIEKVRRDLMLAAWKSWKQETMEKHLDAFKSKIAFTEDAPDQWDFIVRKLLRRVDDPDYVAAASAVLRGAVWRVKNKLNSKPVGQHIMSYLRGRQGCGKSTFLKWFFEPVQEGVTSTTFEMFEHDEKTIFLRDTPIILFDEVARADKADYAKVKNLMTSETAMFRKLYGEATKGRIMSTFFGAGNLDLAEVFHDPTGLRRFFQIEVRQDLYLVMNELQEKVDPLDLWRSVDENAASPLEGSEILQILMSFQKEQRSPTAIEEWLTSVLALGGTSDFLEVGILYSKFAEWKKIHFPETKTSSGSFAIQLKRILSDQSDGQYKYEHKLHHKTRRSMYKFPMPDDKDSRCLIDFLEQWGGA
jgi:predicted P-loop ATPase